MMNYEQVMNWLESNPIIYRLGIGIVLILASFPLGWLFKKIVKALRYRLFIHTETNLDERLAEVFEKRARSIVFSGLALYAIWEIRVAVDEANQSLLRALKIIDAVIYIFAAFVAIGLLIAILRVLIEVYLEDLCKKQVQDTKQLMTVAPLARNLSAVAVVLVVAAVVMEHFSINVGSLLVSLGVGSLAIALAAQDTLANIIAGIIIAIDQPFRVGDRIILPNGALADVDQIGLRSTRLLDFDMNYLVVPNAELVKSTIINQAYPTHKTRVLIFFQVAYGTDFSKAREVVLRITKAHRYVVEEPAPEYQFMKFADSGIDSRVECYVDEYKQKFYAEIELREAIYNALREANIVIPFPQRVLHFATASASPTENQVENGLQKLTSSS